MATDKRSHVSHATITDLDGFAVEDLVQAMKGVEVSTYECDELAANVSLDIC